MKAAVHTHYGSPDVVKIRDVPSPDPGAGEVRVAVHATTVNRTDCGIRTPYPFFIRPVTGLLRPKQTILGMDFAGVIDAVGTGVTSFAAGDRVFGMSPDDFGAHAEFLCVPEDGAIALMPPGLAMHEAVLCEGAWYADTYLEAFGLRAGHSILIYGGSGAIGTAAVQLAKARGAQVTSVVSTPHLELVRSLGADRAIDYTAEDFTRIDDRFDFVFDAVGKTSYFECRGLLEPEGVFSASDLGPGWQNLALSVWSSLTRSGRVVFPMPKAADAAVEMIKTRVETGKLRAVVDRRYPLDAIVEAYRYVETAQKAGIVVVDVVGGLSA